MKFQLIIKNIVVIETHSVVLQREKISLWFLPNVDSSCLWWQHDTKMPISVYIRRNEVFFQKKNQKQKLDSFYSYKRFISETYAQMIALFIATTIQHSQTSTHSHIINETNERTSEQTDSVKCHYFNEEWWERWRGRVRKHMHLFFHSHC